MAPLKAGVGGAFADASFADAALADAAFGEGVGIASADWGGGSVGGSVGG